MPVALFSKATGQCAKKQTIVAVSLSGFQDIE